MSIFDYIRGLMPSFKKSGVLASIEITQHALRSTTVPSLIAAASYFNEHAIASSEGKDLVTVFEKRLGKDGNPVAQTQEILENALAILDFLAPKAKSLYNENEANVSMTYLKATTLRLIETAEFASIYALKWVNQLYVLETAEVDPQTKLRDQLSPAELKWLSDHYLDFLVALTVLRRPVKDIEKALKELPDAFITELTDSVLPATAGESKTDPFALRQMSVAWNPYYLLGLWKAERQAKAYKCKTAELELLQMRLLNLTKIQEKQPDARLQKNIAYQADRVSGLQFELAKMEKEWLHD